MQNGIDNLFAPSIRKMIKENLGDVMFEKIERRLIERHGINLTQAIIDFDKFDMVLREFFGGGADGLETRALRSVIELERSKDSAGIKWVTIRDQDLIKTFLSAFGDPDKKAILNAVLDKGLIITNILEACKIPQTSGYRKINALINDGLLIQSGQIITSDRKKVAKYETVFQNIKINIEKNLIIIRVQMKEKAMVESSILHTVKI